MATGAAAVPDKPVFVTNPAGLLTYLVPPSPVALVSTANLSGQLNVAPFGYTTVVSDAPAIMAVSVHQGCDTHLNLIETGVCVMAYLEAEYAEEIYRTGQPFSPDISEFDETGLTPLTADEIVAPLVQEAIVNLELKITSSSAIGHQTLFLGEVVKTHVRPDIAAEEEKMRRLKLPATYFPTGGYYFSAGELHKVKSKT